MSNERVSIFAKKLTVSEKQISNDRQILINKNQELEQRQIYTEKEASIHLRLSKITLWRLRKAGKISFHRAASKIIYTQADIDSYLESTKRNAFGVTEVCHEK